MQPEPQHTPPRLLSGPDKGLFVRWLLAAEKRINSTALAGGSRIDRGPAPFLFFAWSFALTAAKQIPGRSGKVPAGNFITPSKGLDL